MNVDRQAAGEPGISTRKHPVQTPSHVFLSGVRHNDHFVSAKRRGLPAQISIVFIESSVAPPGLVSTVDSTFSEERAFGLGSCSLGGD